jgi:hypothetical protein
MKKIIGCLIVLSVLSSAAFAQTTVSGSIKKGATGNVVEILAKPNADINAQVGNFNITFSIPDQTLTGGTNPTDASITKASTMNNVNFVPVDGNNPYIIGNRAYYSYLILQNNSATDIPTLLTANTDNVIGSFTFPAPYDPGIRLDDLTSDNGGPNFQMTWYVQFNQGIGDVTNYDTPFYGFYNSGDAVNNGGTAIQFVTLVVKFVNFTVTKRDNEALLNWSVENEGSNTASYEIQKSTNGVDFTPVKVLQPLNNGRTSNSYSTIVENLSSIRPTGVIYFRIKQTDRDGQFVYTEIRSVRLDGKKLVVNVYPNPVKNTANVSYELENNADVVLSVLDAGGKQVFATQVQGFKGSNINKINIGNLASGSYSLKIQAGTDVKVVSLVKVDQ